LRPAAESAMSASRRRCRVAGPFALVTQCVTARRYEGGRLYQSAQAAGSARMRASSDAMKAAAARSCE
jgi:hypothetical protein